MELGVPIAALLGVFLAAPWIAHRIRRRAMRTKTFPTLRWIRTAAIRQESAERISDKYLFALRLVAVAALVMLALDPSCSKSSVTSAHAIVFVLDDSFSMSAPSSDGTPVFERAKKRVAELARDLPPNAEATLVLGGRRPRVLLANAPGAAVATAALGVPSAIRGPGLASAIRAADRLSAESPFADRAIVVVSDFAAHEDLGDVDAETPVHYENVADAHPGELATTNGTSAESEAAEVLVFARNDEAAAPVLRALRALYGPRVAIETNDSKLAADLAAARLVMIVDGADISAEARERIDAWVKSGGGLVVSPQQTGSGSLSGFERLVRDDVPTSFGAAEPSFAKVQRGDGVVIATPAPLTDAAAALTLSERFVPFVATLVREATRLPKLGPARFEAGDDASFDVGGSATLTDPSGERVALGGRLNLAALDELGAYALRSAAQPGLSWVFHIEAPGVERSRRESAAPAPSGHPGTVSAAVPRQRVPLRPWILYAVISMLCAEWALRSGITKRRRAP